MNEFINGEKNSMAPFKQHEYVLNSKSESFSRKVESLIDVWRCFGEIELDRYDIKHLLQILDWAKLHALNIVLTGDWSKSKELYQKQLLTYIENAEQKLRNKNYTLGVRCNQLLAVVKNPWDDPILKRLMTEDNIEIGQAEIDFFCKETAYLISVRLKKLCESQCEDLAIKLVTSFMNCYEQEKSGNFSLNATENQIWFLYDIQVALLHKMKEKVKILKLIKDLSFDDGIKLVKRFANKRVKISQIWRNCRNIAILACHVYLIRALHVYNEQEKAEGIEHYVEQFLRHNIVLSTPEEFETDFRPNLARISLLVLRPPLLYSMCESLQKFEDELQGKFPVELLKPCIIEMYIRALTADMNEIETHKTEKNDSMVTEATCRLAEGYCKLGNFLKAHLLVERECYLTAFSLDPTAGRLTHIEELARKSGFEVSDLRHNWKCKFHPPVMPTDEVTWKCCECNEFMCAKPDLTTVKINMALNEALQNSDLGISEDISGDLVTCLSHPRYQVMSWQLPWQELHRLCIMYMLDPVATKSIVTELKFLDIDFSQYKIKREQIEGQNEDSVIQIDQYLNDNSDHEDSDVDSEASVSQDSRPYSLGSDGAGESTYFVNQKKSNPDTLRTLRLFRPTCKRPKDSERLEENIAKRKMITFDEFKSLKDDSVSDIVPPEFPLLTTPKPHTLVNSNNQQSKNGLATLSKLGGQVDRQKCQVFHCKKNLAEKAQISLNTTNKFFLKRTTEDSYKQRPLMSTVKQLRILIQQCNSQEAARLKDGINLISPNTTQAKTNSEQPVNNPESLINKTPKHQKQSQEKQLIVRIPRLSLAELEKYLKSPKKRVQTSAIQRVKNLPHPVIKTNRIQVPKSVNRLSKCRKFRTNFNYLLRVSPSLKKINMKKKRKKKRRSPTLIQANPNRLQQEFPRDQHPSISQDQNQVNNSVQHHIAHMGVDLEPTSPVQEQISSCLIQEQPQDASQPLNLTKPYREYPRCLSLFQPQSTPLSLVVKRPSPSNSVQEHPRSLNCVQPQTTPLSLVVEKPSPSNQEHPTPSSSDPVHQKPLNQLSIYRDPQERPSLVKQIHLVLFGHVQQQLTPSIIFQMQSYPIIERQQFNIKNKEKKWLLKMSSLPNSLWTLLGALNRCPNSEKSLNSLANQINREQFSQNLKEFTRLSVKKLPELTSEVVTEANSLLNINPKILIRSPSHQPFLELVRKLEQDLQLKQNQKELIRTQTALLRYLILSYFRYSDTIIDRNNDTNGDFRVNLPKNYRSYINKTKLKETEDCVKILDICKNVNTINSTENLHSIVQNTEADDETLSVSSNESIDVENAGYIKEKYDIEYAASTRSPKRKNNVDHVAPTKSPKRKISSDSTSPLSPLRSARAKITKYSDKGIQCDRGNTPSPVHEKYNSCTYCSATGTSPRKTTQKISKMRNNSKPTQNKDGNISQGADHVCSRNVTFFSSRHNVLEPLETNNSDSTKNKDGNNNPQGTDQVNVRTVTFFSSRHTVPEPLETNNSDLTKNKDGNNNPESMCQTNSRSSTGVCLRNDPPENLRRNSSKLTHNKDGNNNPQGADQESAGYSLGIIPTINLIQKLKERNSSDSKQNKDGNNNPQGTDEVNIVVFRPRPILLETFERNHPDSTQNKDGDNNPQGTDQANSRTCVDKNRPDSRGDDRSYVKTVLSNVPGLNDYEMVQPADVDHIINVVQISGGRSAQSVSIPNSQTSTQVTPHIQRIGQPRVSDQKSESTVTTNTTSSTTRSSPLINILSQQIIRPANTSSISGRRQPPVINILSQQIIRPPDTVTTRATTNTTNSGSTTEANQVHKHFHHRVDLMKNRQCG